MKSLVALLASLALTLTMTSFAPAAQAAPPYPGTVATTTNASVQSFVPRKRAIPVTFRVRANGNAQPVGQARFQVFKVLKSGKLRLVRTTFRDVSSNRISRANLNPLPVGRYRVKVSFKPRKSSVFKASGAPLRSFRVVRR